jgi:hypothetical protein
MMNAGFGNAVLDNERTTTALRERPVTAWRTDRNTTRDRPLLPSLRPSVHSQADADFDCLWVTTLGDRTVGMLGVVQLARQVATINRFRVDIEWQHTPVVARLLRQVYDYCWEHDCLKAIVEVGAMPGWMFQIMARSGFLFSRRRQSAEKEQWEFYLDLYRRPYEESCMADAPMDVAGTLAE